jgi:hypothetical protein
MTMDAIVMPTIGDNSRNVPIREILAESHADLAAKVEDLADMAGAAPKVIRDDDDLGKIGDVVKEAVGVAKAVESTRIAAKEPHLKAGREVDAFFKQMIDRIAEIERPLRTMATDYQRAKAAEERRILEEKARRAREDEARQREIARRAEEARRLATSKAEATANLAAVRAAEAESAAANAKAADLTRHRSESGTVVTTATKWTFEIEDIAVIPMETLRPYIARPDIEKAIRTFIRVGGRDLPGVRIFPDEQAAFR